MFCWRNSRKANDDSETGIKWGCLMWQPAGISCKNSSMHEIKVCVGVSKHVSAGRRWSLQADMQKQLKVRWLERQRQWQTASAKGVGVWGHQLQCTWKTRVYFVSLQQLFFYILNKLLQCAAIHGQDSAYIWQVERVWWKEHEEQAGLWKQNLKQANIVANCIFTSFNQC